MQVNRRLLPYFLSICGALFSLYAHASTLQSEFKNIHIYQDEISRSDVKSALTQFEKTDKSAYNFGFKSKPTWFAFQFDKHQVAKPLIISASYPPLDSVEFFKLKNNKLIRLGIAGDLVLESSNLLNNYPSFTITPKNTTDTFLLRIKTFSAHQFELSADDMPTFITKSVISHWFYAAFYGILLSMLFYNLIVFVILRYRPYLFYCFYLLFQILMFSSINGHLYEFVLRGNFLLGNEITLISISMLSAMGIAFTMVFLNIEKDSKVFWRLYWFLLGLNGLVVVLSPFVSYELLIKASMAFGALSSIAVLIGGIYSYLKGNKSARFFILSWTVYLISLVVLVLLRFGFFGTSLFLVHLSEIGAILETLLITLALIDQMNIIRQENRVVTNEIKIKAEELKAKTVKLEQHTFNLSHVLRKPVANILGLIAMLKSSENGRQGQTIDMLEKSGKEIDDILKKESKWLEKNE